MPDCYLLRIGIFGFEVRLKLPRYYSDGRVEENGVVKQEATKEKPANA